MKHLHLIVVTVVALALPAGSAPSAGAVELAASSRVAVLSAPRVAEAGALVVVRIGVSTSARRFPVVVQLRVQGRWRTVSRRTAVRRPGGIPVPVRLTTVGTVRLRVIVAGRPSGPVDVRVLRPALPRVEAGEEPTAIGAGGAGVWVLAGRPGGVSSMVRRLDGAGSAGAWSDLPSPADHLAVGGAEVWAVRDGAPLQRLETATGRVSATPIPGGVRSVAADGAVVWVGGVCAPGASAALDCVHRQAVAIDPATGSPTGTRTDLMPTGQADRVWLVDGTLWLAGEDVDDTNDRRIAPADPVAGALRGPSRRVLGRSADGVPLSPVSATVAWEVNPLRPAVAVPDARALPIVLPGHELILAAPAGPSAWTLQRRRPAAGAQGRAAERLVEVRLADGRRTGRTILLGVARGLPTGLVVHKGVAWVLHPDEGAVLRVTLPRG